MIDYTHSLLPGGFVLFPSVMAARGRERSFGPRALVGATRSTELGRCGGSLPPRGSIPRQLTRRGVRRRKDGDQWQTLLDLGS